MIKQEKNKTMRINFDVDYEVNRALKILTAQNDETISQMMRKLIRNALLKANLTSAVSKITKEGDNKYE